ncbi:MAG: SDR family NAD(P)-dependent oxidoreductase [Chloroflexi bacterium]|nr:SDR family NAD(P)-dependent oxidoreductase [Chloroflexota bacterium]
MLLPVYQGLKDRVAIVTGSGRGIGAAIAMALAEQGVRVVTNGTTPGKAEATAEKIKAAGGTAMAYRCDISQFETAGKLFRAAVDAFGRVDIVVNNAARMQYRTPWEMSESDFDEVIGSSLKSVFNCIRHALDSMRAQRWGRIINTTSYMAWRGMMDNCAYSAAKAGIIGLTMAVAREVANDGITCNAYSPGARTEMVPEDVRQAHLSKQLSAGLISEEHYRFRQKPLPEPDMVAPFITYLCTPEAAAISGKIFRVTGGHIGIYSGLEEKPLLSKAEGKWSLKELIEQVPKALSESAVK